MTSDEFNADIAQFTSRADAQAAADAAMPRRKHGRPYAQSSGYHSARAGHDVWIVLAPSNTALMKDGSMYDCQRRVTIRP